MKLFADRHSWFDHELNCHRLEWCCRFCSFPAFETQEKLAAHMRAQHVQLSSPAQLPVLLQASRQVVDHVPAADCLLCDWESVLRQSNISSSPNETLVVTLDQFCRHVGSHMEQLAFFALPRSDKDQGAEIESNEAAAAVYSAASSLDSTGRRAMSWGSVSSLGATQDQAVPDLALDESLNLLEDITYPSISKPWSRSHLKASATFGSLAFSTKAVYGAAANQTCSTQGGIYLYGGRVGASKVNGGFRMIDMSEEKGIVTFLGQGHGPRLFAAAVLCVTRDAFIVFGGSEASTKVDISDDALYWLDIGILLGFCLTLNMLTVLATSKWSMYRPTNPPCRRDGHTMSIVGSYLCVFGGRAQNIYLSDLHVLNLDHLKTMHPSWQTVTITPKGRYRIPSKRTRHTMVTMNDRLYLYASKRRYCIAN